MSTTRAFIREIMMGVGFLSGVWAGLGFNPQKYAILETVRALQPYLQDSTFQLNGLVTMVHLFFGLMFLAGVAASYSFGRGLGLLAFFLAFFAGGLLIVVPEHAVVLLLAAATIALVIGERRPNQSVSRI